MGKLEFWDLSGVSDQRLLQDLGGFIANGAGVEANVVAHLAEVEERRLHLKAATSSLFDYCLRRLNLSESEAFHRIIAARLARNFPVIFELLAARSIHLSALRVLRDHLTSENHRELLSAASGKSKKEVEALVAAFAPRPDVASRIRKLPVRRLLPSSSGTIPVVALAPSANQASSRPLAAGSNQTSSQPIAHPSESNPASSRPLALASAPESNQAGTQGFILARESNLAGSQSLASERAGQHEFDVHESAGDVADASIPEAPSSAVRGPLSLPVPELVVGDGEDSGGRPGPAGRARRRHAIEPLSSTRYLLRVSVSREFKDKLSRARDLMSHGCPSGELETVLERALDSLLEKLEKQRFARTKRPRTAQEGPLEPSPPRARGRAAVCTDVSIAGAFGYANGANDANSANSESQRRALPQLDRREFQNAVSGSAESGSAESGSSELAIVRPSSSNEGEARMLRETPVVVRARREHIPNAVRRAVALRDRDQCTYVDDEGRRCSSRAFLQLHHEVAHALGGPSTLENLRLLCGPHNRLLAERDFGRAHQERFVSGQREKVESAVFAPR